MGMGMSHEGYNAEADFAATGSVVCADCGSRISTPSLATLPAHDCATVQRANRLLLAQVLQQRVFRDVAGGVQVWNTNASQATVEPVDYAALARLVAAGMVSLRDVGREPYYEITDRAELDHQ